MMLAFVIGYQKTLMDYPESWADGKSNASHLGGLEQ